MQRGFRQVDVFGSGPYTGNPVAVVHDAEGLSDAEMARISDWTHLSECTFVLAPTTPAADYRVRIFSLDTELPFAGHPTLGTARAWLDAGGTPRDETVVVQECAAGLIRVRRGGDDLAFAAPPTIRGGEVEDAYLAEVASILGIRASDVVAAQWVDNGPGWVAVLLADAAAVLALEPSTAGHPGPWKIGVAGLHSADPGAAGAADPGAAGAADPGAAGAADPGAAGADREVEVRAFFTHGGPLMEDPVTGSLHASLAQWLTASGRVSAPYTARQGTALGRAGRVRVSAEGGDLWIGGATHVAIRGELDA